MATREKSGQKRNDLIDTLIELKNNDENNIIGVDDIGKVFFSYFYLKHFSLRKFLFLFSF